MLRTPYMSNSSAGAFFKRKRILSCSPLHVLAVLFAFFVNTLGPIPFSQAQEFRLPAPGVMIQLSPPLNPPILKGIKVYPSEPFRFDFILDVGDRHPQRSEGSQQEHLKQESTRLIKYFLASLTIPEKDLWVNLSPYEKTGSFADLGRISSFANQRA